MAMTKNGRAASGAGTIRKRTVTRNGKPYTYWEARLTVGYDPLTGKQKQRSFSGKTQKEVREKLQSAAVEVNNGSYIEPCKLTLGEWLDIWQREYLVGLKPYTIAAYESKVRLHIKPALGDAKLTDISPHRIQKFYNALSKNTAERAALAPKTIKLIHGVLHEALQQAVINQYIRQNPSIGCKLPKIEQKEITPLDEKSIPLFLNAIKGHRFEALFTVTLFTGMRQGEVLGLRWSCIDFNNGTILIDKQLQKSKDDKSYSLISLKNDKPRLILPAPWIMQLLREHKVKQTEQQLKAGGLWQNTDFVFTNEIGNHLTVPAVYQAFKRVVAEIGYPNVRFHDLRHSYAVAAIRSGDDIKTVQESLGHATPTFTLNVYTHVTEQMKRDSANRMEQYIKGVLNL